MILNNDTIFLRASLAPVCNFNCIYCPTELGMENQTPNFLKGNKLTVEQYRRNLGHFKRNGIKAITFTGGEPALNNDLYKILSYARKNFEKVEITTNGYNFKKNLLSYFDNVDIVKISLDAVDKNVYEEITQRSYKEFNNTLEAILEACKAGLKIGINVAIMKKNISQIDKIIDLCKKINNKYNTNAYVSILDLYFSPGKRKFWEENFIPLNKLISYYTSKYSKPSKQERFGCQFFWFNVNGIRVRFKESISATQRAEKCNNCNEYCQEGVFSIKHSVEGWVTYCLSENVKHGVSLDPSFTDDEADNVLKPIFDDIINSQTDNNSFTKLLSVHKLEPKNLNYEF